MHIHPFRAVYPNLEFIPSPDTFFEAIREDFTEFADSGFFQRTPEEVIFVYQIRTAGRSFTGVIACVDIRDYLVGSIRKHEHTLPEKEQKQIQLLLRRQATVKPVLLAYPVVRAIDEWTQAFIERHRPFLQVRFEREDQEHLLWEVSLPADLEAIRQLFARDVPHTYIADGHHRTTSTALLYERADADDLRRRYARMLCTFFPTSELIIHDFNRVVEIPPDLSLTRLMVRLSQLGDLEIVAEPARPRRKHEVLLFVNQEWYFLRWKPAVLHRYRHADVVLDIQLLNELVLADILGIDSSRADQAVEYVEGPLGIEGVRRRASQKASAIGFCLYPVQPGELMTLADNGDVLPPKSTWFEPRMINGLIVQEV